MRTVGVQTHNANGYSVGCRCAFCRDAWNAQRREQRSAARQAADRGETVGDVRRHGTRYAYEQQGCRCDICDVPELRSHNRKIEVA